MALAAGTALDAIAAALASNSDRFVFDKTAAASAAAGFYASFWRASGVPAAGAIPAAAAICDKTLTGAISFNNQTAPVTSYLAWAYMLSGTAGQSAEMHDRLAHMGGLSGIVTTAQTVGIDLSTLGGGLVAARRGDANYSDVMWWLEVYTALGATGVNATCAVTYDDGSTGNVVVAVPATAPIARMIPIQPAIAGRWIRGISTVTLSATTGTAGNFGITATRQRSILRTDVANKGQEYTWAQLGVPEIPNDSCLYYMLMSTAAASHVIRGGGKIIHA